MTNVRDSWDHLASKLRHICERGSKQSNYFLTIRGLFDEEPKLVLYDDTLEPGVDLIHYTTWKNALEMFKKNQRKPILRMYNYEQSNDPNEGQIKPPGWGKIETEARCFFDEFLKDDGRWTKDMTLGWSTYGCSFSSGPSGVEDDLTYWRLYGNNGQGCSLKISRSNGNIYEWRYRMYKVRYRDDNGNKRTESDKKEDEQVAERLRNLFEICKETVQKAPEEHKHTVRKTVAEGLFRIIHSYYHLIKHVAYAREKEWRMIRIVPEQDDIRYDITSENVVKSYVKGPSLKRLLSSASSITIGPTVPNRGAARAYLEYLAEKKHKIRYVDVKNSNRTYRQ